MNKIITRLDLMWFFIVEGWKMRIVAIQSWQLLLEPWKRQETVEMFKDFFYQDLNHDVIPKNQKLFW